MSTMTLVEIPTKPKTNSIFIRPYVDANRPNMGLEKYELSVYDGVVQIDQLAMLDINGTRRFLTGLNEFAPEVKLIQDTDTREAKIKFIRETVAQLEKDLASNVIDPKDTEFWNKVTLLKPDNNSFWGKIDLRASNQAQALNPEENPFDLIKMLAIEAGGFPMVAKSYEDAKMASTPPKFYLDKQIDTISTKTEVTKIRNRALSELQKMFDKNTNKLFYVAKIVDVNSAQYKKSTPNDIVYQNMDNHITGKGHEKNLKRAAQQFLDVTNLDMEMLKIRAIIKDATFYKFIALRPDGFIYEMEGGAMMGRTPAECVEYLKNPLNQEIFTKLMDKTEKYWNK